MGDACEKGNSVAILRFKSSLVVGPARKDLLLNLQSNLGWLDGFKVPGHIKYFFDHQCFTCMTLTLKSIKIRIFFFFFLKKNCKSFLRTETERFSPVKYPFGYACARAEEGFKDTFS